MWSWSCLATVVLGRVHDAEVHDVGMLARECCEPCGDGAMLDAQSVAHIFTDENFVSSLQAKRDTLDEEVSCVCGSRLRFPQIGLRE